MTHSTAGRTRARRPVVIEKGRTTPVAGKASRWARAARAAGRWWLTGWLRFVEVVGHGPDYLGGPSLWLERGLHRGGLGVVQAAGGQAFREEEGDPHAAETDAESRVSPRGS